MGEQVQHSYQCQSLGCSNGHQSTFYAAPPEWFSGKGINTPKNCPDCRAWVKSQIDSAHRCKSCGYAIRQSAKAKITHHKRKGIYEPPNECRHCAEGEKKPKGIYRRPPKPKPLYKKRDPEKLEVVPYDGLSSYRKQHYGKHVVGHPDSKVGQPMANGRAVSATTLVSYGATSVDLYNAGDEIAKRCDAGVYQYTSKKNGNVLKVTVVSETHVELTVFKPLGNNMYEFVSSYDEVSLSEANKNVGTEWV